MNMFEQSKRISAAMIALGLIVGGAIHAADQAATPAPADKEAELLGILTSDAPPADKALACKNLTVHGTSKSVSELAKLLSNEHLASWARIPLESIPGPEADDALRQAAKDLKGLLLVGTINSIGVRRDGKAVEDLATRLQDADPQIASAAAVALGRIGSDSAAAALKQVLASAPEQIKSAVAEGYVLCAEQRRLDGRNAESIAIYDEIRGADVPKQRIREATRGAILARKDDGIPLLIEQFHSFDKGLFQIALSTAREFPGDKVDQALAKEMASAQPDRAALIIGAMADRPETVVLPAILSAAEKREKEVRLAAIAALGRVGNTSCLSSLLEFAVEPDTEIVQASKKSLGEIPGENVDKYIVTRLAKAEGKVYPVLLELVGNRRIDALPSLYKAIENSDAVVRSAALTSLGATVPPEQLSTLIKYSVTPKHAEDSTVALAALKTASVRMPDREVCGAELSSAFDRASVPTKVALLKILGEVAGTKALQTIGAAAKNNDAQIQDVASQLLGDWLTPDCAPVLLDLSKNAPTDKVRVRAMRGYIRVARQFAMSDPERIEMIRTATAACFRNDERKLVIDVLKRYPNVETLKLAVKALQTPELKDDADAAILVIAAKLDPNAGEVRDILSKLTLNKAKVEILSAMYGSGNGDKDVTDIIKKNLKDTPLVILPPGGYNENFGGDPAPGAQKKLKIQYKLNDRPGEIALSENAAIVLPVPKEKK